MPNYVGSLENEYMLSVFANLLTLYNTKPSISSSIIVVKHSNLLIGDMSDDVVKSSSEREVFNGDKVDESVSS